MEGWLAAGMLMTVIWEWWSPDEDTPHQEEDTEAKRELNLRRWVPDTRGAATRALVWAGRCQGIDTAGHRWAGGWRRGSQGQASGRVDREAPLHPTGR